VDLLIAAGASIDAATEVALHLLTLLAMMRHSSPPSPKTPLHNSWLRLQPASASLFSQLMHLARSNAALQQQLESYMVPASALSWPVDLGNTANVHAQWTQCSQTLSVCDS
jgi:hypothetical protein